MTLSSRWWPLVFIGPALLGLIALTWIPVLVSLGLSFCRWDLLGTPNWVGLENYNTLFHDPLFWKTLGNTLIFVSGSVSLEVTLALGLALLLNRAIRGVGLFRTLFFLPVVTPMVSVALVWGWLYDPQYGGINALLHLVGIHPIAWLFDSHWAMPAIIFLRVWKEVGYTMLLLLAGLQAIPTHLWESAALDGANGTKRFWYVTLPMLSPTLFFVLTVCLINAFQAFDSVYLLTQGGPQHSTQVLVYWVFQNAFQFYKVGPASAMAYVLFVLVLAITVIQWQLRKRWVLYESDT